MCVNYLLIMMLRLFRQNVLRVSRTILFLDSRIDNKIHLISAIKDLSFIYGEQNNSDSNNTTNYC